MKYAYCILTCLMATVAFAGTLDDEQSKYFKQYKKQKNVPKPEEQQVNTDVEPDLEKGFVSLFNGKDLTGWTPKGGTCTFEVKDGVIVGTCVKKSPSTWLCTDKTDYEDFIFTCDMKWDVDGNSGIQFRSQIKGKGTVFGPQFEMEGFAKKRGWSGGIYGQSCGGWFYPLWLEAHKKARAALKKNDWNRVTIMAKGNVVKTWINGIPAACWIDDTYKTGFIGLQVHAGKQGTILWRNLKVKELTK